MPTIDAPLICTRCGAQVDTADLEAACHHCGTRLADMLDLGLIDREARVVTADVPCVSCQYNLRTIPLASRCPECATPVTASLRRGELHLAPVDWLQAMRRGVTLLAASFAVPLGQMVASTVATTLLSPTNFPIYWLSNLIFESGAIILLCLGSLSLTRPERLESNRALGRRARVLRVTAIGLFVSYFAATLAPFVRYAWVNGLARLLEAKLEDIFILSGTHYLDLGLWLLYIVLFVIAVLLLVLYLRTLAVRAVRRGLRKALNLALVLLAIQAATNAAMIMSIMGISLAGFFGRWYQLYYTQLASHALAYIILMIVCIRLRQNFKRALAGRRAERV